MYILNFKFGKEVPTYLRVTGSDFSGTQYYK
jgi:hypothetical protein